MSRKRQFTGSFLVNVMMFSVMVVLAVGMEGCGKKEEGGRPKGPIPVTVMTVTPKDVPIDIEFVGTTESSHQVEIRARVEGFLEKKTYEEGGRVKAGQTMFQIDRRPFEASLQQARGALAQQEAKLINAESTLKRVRPLAERNAASQKDLDDAVSAEKTARAAVFSAQGSVQDAELKLSYTTIVSPVDGLAGRAKKQEGSYISMGQDSLLTYVAKIDPIWVDFSISENENLKLNDQVAKGLFTMPKGSNFEVEVRMADGSIFPQKGRLNFADPSFSSETGTYQVRAEIPNPIHSPKVIRPGQFVRVRLKGGIRPNGILVPRSAVSQGAQGFFVWVAGKDGKAQFRSVQVGDWHENDIFINSGLTAGEQIILDNLLKMSPEAPLKMIGVATAQGEPPAKKPKSPAKPEKP
ncbi:MAG TPA: efflux RND transporter periplasmic adaptor subunit [Smithellaceae bacterium]|nr:efflux RND transporter periplasmic adaptor subunit [Smithellaceae bacterium]